METKKLLTLLLVAAVITGCANGNSGNSEKTTITSEDLENLKDSVYQLADTYKNIMSTEDEDLYENADYAAPETEITSESDGSTVTISYVDVGQGDCTIIQDGGETMIIDTGYWSEYDKVQSTLAQYGIDKVETLVLTHPDADHIGSADKIIEDYDVDTVYMTEKSSDSKTYQFLMDSISYCQPDVIYPKAGEYIDFGYAEYQIVGPVKTYSDPNSCSLVLKVVNGDDSFLFTGDMTGEEYDDIVASGFDLSATVLKAAHHGSANDGCNSDDLFNRVSPDSVIISCGANNQYGHPHVETIDLIGIYGCEYFRTDSQGTITCVSDGETIEWSTEPCASVE